MSRDRIGVVTVSYGSEEVLSRFFPSLAEASERELVVVVADNKPAAGGPVRELADRFAARYVPLPANPGYGSAMNAGVAALPDDVRWILLTNPDIEISPGAIDRLLEVGESDGSIGAVGPLVMTDGAVYPSARTIPSLRNGIGHALFASIWPKNPWSARYHSDTANPPHERDAGWLSGSCLLVRREAFAALGGFDDGYFMYFEDVDLGYRLGKTGWRNRYAPNAVVAHSGAHSTTENSGKMIRAHHDSAYRFLSGKYRGPVLAPLRWVLKAGLSARAFALTTLRRR
jgi:N-acetylglucosaminyl-diphospho-decaprenol L-rhamnosyltransferase